MREKLHLLDWIQFFSSMINTGNVIIFGCISIVILIAVSLYLFADWAKLIIFIAGMIVLVVVYWFMYGEKSRFRRARIFLDEIMCGEKDDSVKIQEEWCNGGENMEESKNRINYGLWIVVGIIVGILIGLSTCLLLSSGILSEISIEVFLPQFLGSFLALLIALFVFWLGQYYSKKKEEKRQKEFRKNLNSMIKDEIEFNMDKVGQMKTEVPKNLYPTYRLKTNNKDACWAKIVEYRHKEHELIDDISLLYYKYDILNRTIDLFFQGFFSKMQMPGIEDEIKRLCKKIEEKSKKVLKKF